MCFSCIGSALGSCVGSALCSGCGHQSKTSRLPYLIFLSANVILAVILSFFGSNVLGEFAGLKVTVCPNQSSPDTCLQNAAVFRVSFALAIFFAIHVAGCFISTGCYYACWPLKLVAYAGGLVGAFFIENNEIFEGYAQVARIVSILYLLLQVILLIDFSYLWNETWIESENPNMLKAIVAISLSLFALCIVAWALMLVYFTDSAGGNCSQNKALVSVTVILVVAFTAISISQWCEHGALLTSSVVAIYVTFVLYSALSSDPSACNSVKPARGSAQQWIGLAFAAISISYAGYNLSKRNGRLFGGGDDGDDGEGVRREPGAVDLEGGAASDTEEQKTQKEKDVEEEDDGQNDKEKRRSNTLFQICLLLASMYMAMVLSNWGVDADALRDPGGTDDVNQLVDVSTVSLWVKIASQWLTIALYGWTLIAPQVLAGREF